MTNPFLHYYVTLVSAKDDFRFSKIESSKMAAGLSLFVAASSLDASRSVEDLSFLVADISEAARRVLSIDHNLFTQHLLTIVIIMTKFRSL